MNSEDKRYYIFNHSSRFFPIWNNSTGEQVTGILELISYIRQHKNPAVCLEIGSNIGESALLIASHKEVEKLYCVDPFYDEEQYKQFLNRINHLKSKIEIIRKKSCDIYNNFILPVDVIYIDGDHSYETVKNDLEFGYNIIKDGGFICGHDYGKAHNGVLKAVDEFIKEKNLKISRQFLDSSFAIRKNND